MVRNYRQPTNSNAHFAVAPQVSVQRSTFDRSHGIKTTLDANWLVPIFLDEVLPGDTFKLTHSLFGRIATPITPIMDNLYLETFYFFVPTRLVWDNWQKFNGEREDPDDSIDFTIPQVVVDYDNANILNSIYDYMGIPVQNLTQDISVNVLPFRCYNLIINEFFRDQNLIDSLYFTKGNGPDVFSGYGLFKRGKRHDYFTSCLPWPQKGDAVDLPLGISAPVELDLTQAGTYQLAKNTSDFTTDTPAGSASLTNVVSVGRTFTSSVGTTPFVIDPNGTLIADLSDATAATINQLREAFQVQRLLEKDARGGTRYTEILKSHFGVTSPDSRLQRPEYLGGSHSNVNISPIPQTSESTVDSPQGNLASYGTFQSIKRVFNHSFTEHGYIIGLCNVRADLTYQQGLDRLWSRETRYDFYWPVLSHLGEQEVLTKEIYATGDSANDDLVFGYQERYAEYRYKPSRITGNFRSGVTDSLDIWHLAINFSGAPTLSQGFIQENVPMDRVKAVEDFPDFILDGFFDYKCTRPMPVYSIPGYIDHF